jgi:hypothetical protein
MILISARNEMELVKAVLFDLMARIPHERGLKI